MDEIATVARICDPSLTTTTSKGTAPPRSESGTGSSASALFHSPPTMPLPLLNVIPRAHHRSCVSFCTAPEESQARGARGLFPP